MTADLFTAAGGSTVGLADFSIDEVGLFDEADLVPSPPPLVLPNNLIPLQAGASLVDVIDLACRWKVERSMRGWAVVREAGPVYAWEPTVCGPSFDTTRTDHHPVILSLDVRCDPWGHETRAPCSCVGDLLYRHGCAGCGQLDETRDDENAAVEDAMDHGWPGWRDLPVLACAMPDETKKRATWLAAAVELYPLGWIEAGGPIRTARGGRGTRHVAHRTPFYGYDLGASVAQDNYLNHTYRPGAYVAPDTTEQDA